jgi:SAM-dependent methyltransferase
MKFIALLKKIPIDVGQAEKKHNTAGKRIAFSFVPMASKGAQALDIGCRDGYWSERLKERGYLVTSLDIEPHYEGAITRDVENGLPFSDHSFDLIWCTEVVEHLRDPNILFKEIERIVRPGGEAILTTPNSAWWFYFVVGLWGWTPKRLQNADHKQFFNIAQLQLVAKGYEYFGYFPYALVFFRIRRAINALSPTFILRRLF